ncbi:hypothetical protein B0I35DRAFT_415025 [Stachybotrys elegans]|uniref:Uncharacterized protein n=1 Tax=Stachybotrys elegans TaxID=80388 RepID=A0A8K0SDW4_9HYPO|nr:hypothetical protein B0I35DRAFT_415025 [Stachybotrys elegans]
MRDELVIEMGQPTVSSSTLAAVCPSRHAIAALESDGSIQQYEYGDERITTTLCPPPKKVVPWWHESLMTAASKPTIPERPSRGSLIFIHDAAGNAWCTTLPHGAPFIARSGKPRASLRSRRTMATRDNGTDRVRMVQVPGLESVTALQVETNGSTLGSDADGLAVGNSTVVTDGVHSKEGLVVQAARVPLTALRYQLRVRMMPLAGAGYIMQHGEDRFGEHQTIGKHNAVQWAESAASRARKVRFSNTPIGQVRDKVATKLNLMMQSEPRMGQTAIVTDHYPSRSRDRADVFLPLTEQDQALPAGEMVEREAQKLGTVTDSMIHHAIQRKTGQKEIDSWASFEGPVLIRKNYYDHDALEPATTELRSQVLASMFEDMSYALARHCNLVDTSQQGVEAEVLRIAKSLENLDYRKPLHFLVESGHGNIRRVQDGGDMSWSLSIQDMIQNPPSIESFGTESRSRLIGGPKVMRKLDDVCADIKAAMYHNDRRALIDGSAQITKQMMRDYKATKTTDPARAVGLRQKLDEYTAKTISAISDKIYGKRGQGKAMPLNNLGTVAIGITQEHDGLAFVVTGVNRGPDFLGRKWGRDDAGRTAFLKTMYVYAKCLARSPDAHLQGELAQLCRPDARNQLVRMVSGTHKRVEHLIHAEMQAVHSLPGRGPMIGVISSKLECWARGLSYNIETRYLIHLDRPKKLHGLHVQGHLSTGVPGPFAVDGAMAQKHLATTKGLLRNIDGTHRRVGASDRVTEGQLAGRLPFAPTRAPGPALGLQGQSHGSCIGNRSRRLTSPGYSVLGSASASTYPSLLELYHDTTNTRYVVHTKHDRQSPHVFLDVITGYKYIGGM